MEKHLGIDFGTKKVGVALSDDAGRLAFPYAIFPNDKTLLRELVTLAKEKSVAGIVVGESRNLSGEQNPVMRTASSFAQALEHESGIPVFYEPEFFSTKEAAHMSGESTGLDAGAAAVILQSFLDKRNQSGQGNVSE